jgi:hypothetical protein
MNISDHYEQRAASTIREKMSEMGSEKEILEWKLYSTSDDVQAAAGTCGHLKFHHQLTSNWCIYGT